MAKNSKIAWCHHTFNPWIGCSKVHTGCLNCYAEELMANRYGRVKWGPSGTRSKTKTWGQPIAWNAEAAKLGVRYKVFCASLADVFEDRPELTVWRTELFQLIDKTPYLDWLLLTKRPENIQQMWPDSDYRHNVWCGTSPCDQKTSENSIDKLGKSRLLYDTAFLSCEPLVGPIKLRKWLKEAWIDWVIVGGESGRNARVCDLNWLYSIDDETNRFNVALFVKQLGSNVVDVNGNKLITKSSKGDDPSEWPNDLVIREFPDEQ